MKANKLNFIDLFAGCGGLSEGFLQTGKYRALAHVEWEKPMVETLRKRLIDKWNHSEDEAQRRVVHFDIQRTEELLNGGWQKDCLEIYGMTNHPSIIRSGLSGLLNGEKVDLVIGGPPCQAYSIAGRAQDKNSMKLDYRNYLFESFMAVVEALDPDAFIFENVPGLLSAKPGNIPVTARIFEAFDSTGYQIRNPNQLKRAIYDSSDFNVPQKRNRVIIVGVKKDGPLILDKLYASISSKKSIADVKKVKDVLSDLPPLIPVESSHVMNGRKISHYQPEGEVVMFHVPRFHNRRDIDIFRYWLEHDMNHKNSDEKIAYYNNLFSKSSNHAKYRNLEWNKPSPTIVAHLHKDGLMFIHPDIRQARSITVKEAAMLQSFPDDFEFVGSMGDCYKMIGNAVPPEMARLIADGVFEYLKHEKKIKKA